MKKVLCLVLIMSCILALCACKPKSELSNYITNYDEVMAVIESRFSNPKIKDGPSQSTVKEFGEGEWKLYVNDITVRICVHDRVAVTIVYSDGNRTHTVITPAGEDWQYQNFPPEMREMYSSYRDYVNQVTSFNSSWEFYEP